MARVVLDAGQESVMDRVAQMSDVVKECTPMAGVDDNAVLDQQA
jgi:hypothetical protein